MKVPNLLVRRNTAFPSVWLIAIASFLALGQASVIPGGLVTVKVKLRIVYAGDDFKPSTEDAIDEDDVESFEFDEDGNLIDSAPIKTITPDNPAGKGGLPIHCPRFPAVI